MNGRKPHAGHWPPRNWVIVLATLIAAIVVVAVLFDWNWLKGPIERRVSAATGREFAIEGDLDVDFGRIVHIRAARVRLGNAKWSGRRVGNTWRYRDFEGRVGDSDISGDVSVELGGERPRMRGELVSQRLDFDDLAGAIGGTPQTGAGESASPEQRERAASNANDTTVLPERPFNLTKLRAMDADVSVRAQRIDAPKLPLESMVTRVKLEDGVLRLDPLEMHAAGGTIRGKVTLDARADPITTTTDVQLRQLDLKRVFPQLKTESTGRISGKVTLAGKGNSVATMLASADGRVAAVMGPGRVSNLMVELAGLDVAEALRYAIGKDKMIGVRCACRSTSVERSRIRRFARPPARSQRAPSPPRCCTRLHLLL